VAGVRAAPSDTDPEEATPMNSAFAVLLTAAATLAADGPGPSLIRRGGDPSRGLLVNRTVGSRPFDPPDPGLPTVVFVHGFNPLPRVVHFTMAEEFGRSLSRRGGPPTNVLAWDWNAATFESWHPGINLDVAVHQGHALARALRGAGIDPARTHLIGHSAGAIVATSAARVFAVGHGRPVHRLTLLEPASYYHALVFERMAAGSLAPLVENYWCPGPSAYGREVSIPGVWNYRVDGPASYAGVVFPLRSDHLFIVYWYLRTVENPQRAWGYNSAPIPTR
jgi:pimeloyl-ACP methyl ester carboxylesterase